MLILEKARKHANQLNYDRDADDIWALFKLFPVAVLVAYFNCHHLALELGLKLTKRNLSVWDVWVISILCLLLCSQTSRLVNIYLDVVNILTDAFPKTSNV